MESSSRKDIRGSAEPLGRDRHNLSGFGARQSGACFPHKRTEVGKTVGFGLKDDHGYVEFWNMLLETDAAVGGQENVKSVLNGFAQKTAVPGSGPAEIRYGPHDVPRKALRQLAGNAFVEQDIHFIRLSL